jgi:type IV secretory pathway TraG/TraD family ATPase VirD4
MKARSADRAPVGKFIAGAVAVVLLLCVFGAIGQLLGSLVFGLLEKLPDSSVGVTTLYRYWPVYGGVPHVRRSLQIATTLSVVVAIGPAVIVVLAVLFGKFKRRELHGSARWATIGEIRKAGLVGDDQ